MPKLRARLLETIRNAYPETFEDLNPSKALEESVSNEPKPQLNALLNCFIQQKGRSALPVACHMATRAGFNPRYSKGSLGEEIIRAHRRTFVRDLTGIISEGVREG